MYCYASIRVFIIRSYTILAVYIFLLNFLQILQSGEVKDVMENSYIETSTSGEEFVKAFSEPGGDVSDLLENAELATGVVVTELLLDQLCEKVRSHWDLRTIFKER